MSASKADGAIRRAQARLRVASDLAARALAEVTAAKRILRGQRDELAAWIIQGINATLDDSMVEEAPSLLLEDVGPLPEVRARMRWLKAEAKRKPSAAEVRAARAAA